MIVNRRDFIRAAALGTAGVWADAQMGDYILAQASRPSTIPLLKEVESACRRLGRHGWRELLLSVTSNELDIMALDLSRELTKKLNAVKRESPGFEDFAAEGQRGIEPGSPAQSLLLHAIASPAVTQGVPGKALTDFATPAELKAIEDYVYGVRPPTMAELRARAKGAPLAVVVFSNEYRTVSHTVLRKHADMCFSRSSFARVGTVEARYDGRRREFLPFDERDPFAFRVQPARYAAYIAMQSTGQQNSFGPMRFQKEDEGRKFWVPLHKLFSGRECLMGYNLEVTFTAHYINEKLRRFHQFMASQSQNTGWKEPDINNYPFVLRDDTIADFSSRVEDGPGLIMPRTHALFEKARYQGKLLGFDVPPGYSTETGNTWFSTLQILPVPESESDTTSIEGSLFGDGIAYRDGLNTTVGRHAPEYLNTRHKLLPDGQEVDLNDCRDVLEQVIAGGYRAQHYVDFTADGWVAAVCPQLAQEITTNVPAYSAVSPPDFFPSILQRELMEWWERDSPPALREGLWCIQPLALSDRRMAANINLPAGFTITDDSVTAIVSHPAISLAEQRPRPAGETSPLTRLPDGSNGIFDPGWDVSQDTDKDGALFLQNYGLGTPFVEDVKLCAALGSFWPAVAPDSTRTFQPNKEPQGSLWPWPTIVPLTDEEIGVVEVKGGGFYPWDGVQGPKIVTQDGQELVQYPDINHVDYINLAGKMTALLTSRIDLREYQTRVLAMGSVYGLLGLHDADFLRRYKTEDDALNRFQLAKSRWAVVSFRKVDASTEELETAQKETQTNLQGPHRYRFHVCRYGKTTVDPKDFRKVLVEMQDQLIVYIDRTNALLQYKGGKWMHEKSILMS
jgi:hypothetical protein